jgi:hypothetical protein
MSQLSYAWEQALVEEVPTVATDWYDPPPRSIWQVIGLGVPVILATAGAFLTAPMLVDLAFIALAALVLGFLIADLSCFSERFGLGGIILFGGVLIFFCVDYLRTWLLAWLPHWDLSVAPHTVAVAAAYHMLYIMCAVIGLRMRAGRWFARLMTSLKEPPNLSAYFWVVIITQIIGLSPYFFFTHEPFYLALWHQISAGRNGEMGTRWIAGRTGNLNYSWAAYIAEMLEVGSGGGILASFCIVFLRQGIVKNTICALIWILSFLLAFGTGARSDVVRQCLPLVCFIFIRYHVEAQQFLRKFSLRAYVIVGVLLLLSVATIQIQERYRVAGFADINFSEVSYIDIQGNDIFSTTLPGFALIPDRHDFFYNSYPGETVVMPIPNLLIWTAIAPIPRALWTTKPIDPSWKWYNAVFTGRSTLGGGAAEGTTISEGIVGYWYFRFGLPGVVEGGLFIGWILGCAERALLNNRGRPMAVLVTLGIFSWIFKAFRDIAIQDLMQVCTVLVGMQIAIWCISPFFSRPEAPQMGTADY